MGILLILEVLGGFLLLFVLPPVMKSDTQIAPERSVARVRHWMWGLACLAWAIPLLFLVPPLLLAAIAGEKIHVNGGYGSWLLVLGFLELITAMPYIIHLPLVLYWTRRNAKVSRRGLFVIWGGNIGITVGVAGWWALFTIFVVTAGDPEAGQSILAIIFLPPIALALNLVGYVAGLVVSFLFVHDRSRSASSAQE